MFNLNFCTHISKTAKITTEKMSKFANDGVCDLKNAITTTITHAEAIKPEVAERKPFKTSAATRDSLNLLKHL